MAEAATLSSHVLDLGRGRPAAGLAVQLYDGSGAALASGVTDDDGRVARWSAAATLAPGVYRLVFSTGAWFAARGEDTLYPEVTIAFRIEGAEHYHIPLLLSAYGYSTYRGS
ncbi:hydroxyisourate hydrolase [Pseudohaliea rubra]|uniref:5-hydroxyisourate hydrolase n=1 Tax=Pseudohaliea rubra DSM 19751 TaxID=1265313 RepID=A0A095XVH8_9GAMM|nr:hydroxyisourate hydrolase [Pseudohaliea rubra]KGE03676.1 5-Hydroxyisourate Hydrolase (HIUase) [Pseudohaliea rubra DSM 19751]